MKFRPEYFLSRATLTALIAWVAASSAGADIVRNPVHAGVALEGFQLYKPTNTLDQDAAFSLPFVMVRPIGWVFGSATIDERMDLVFGLGATLFSIPSDSGQHPAGYQNEVYPAVATVQASGSYAWGDPGDPALKASFGAMPYKYGPDAREFGEYLLRSTPYPGSVLNSPFDVVNGAQAHVLGGVLTARLLGGKWQHDLLLTSVTNTFPLGDLSLSYITGFKLNPVFEIGAGVNLYRLIPFQSDLTRYKAGENAYFSHGGKTYSANSNAYKGRRMTAGDSLMAAKADSVAESLSDKSGATPLPTGVSGVDYYGLDGQMLMARFSLNFRPLLGEDVDLKLYGEWAMLGVQDRPVFYEKPVERMPIMLGLGIPTWGWLDYLNVEAEYWKNPYLNSNYAAAYHGSGTPNLFLNAYGNVGLESTADRVDDDDLSWSVSASKSFGGSFSVMAKAARDHMQVMQFHSNSFDKSYGDVMSGAGSWYYVLRMQVSI